MVYCMSDIHGEFDRFREMLNLIEFSEADTLYVIGDVIDRGAGGIDILWEILENDNILLIRGNHEQMCLDTLGPHNIYGARDLWQANGGSITRRELLYHIDAHQRNRLLRYIGGTPLRADVEVEGKKFILVHGAPGTKQNTQLWARPDEYDWGQVPDGVTCIIGHTPVCYLTEYPAGTPFSIYHGRGFICIDCGCGNKTPDRRLACLRLNDMKEYYV